MPQKAKRNWRTRTPQIAFGIVLRQLREKAGHSQDSFAHATGYHRNYIGQLERGEKSPSLSALFNLSQALDRVPSQLLPPVEKQLGLAKQRDVAFPPQSIYGVGKRKDRDLDE